MLLRYLAEQRWAGRALGRVGWRVGLHPDMSLGAEFAAPTTARRPTSTSNDLRAQLPRALFALAPPQPLQRDEPA